MTQGDQAHRRAWSCAHSSKNRTEPDRRVSAVSRRVRASQLAYGAAVGTSPSTHAGHDAAFASGRPSVHAVRQSTVFRDLRAAHLPTGVDPATKTLHAHGVRAILSGDRIGAPGSTSACR